MLPDSRFRSQPPVFWAYVRTLSQFIGYTDKGGIRALSVEERERGLREPGLDVSRCVTRSGDPTPLGTELLQYFTHRAHVLEESARPALMTADAAEALFFELKPSATSNTPLPMNKQKGEKRRHAFFTCIINILISRTLQDIPCDYAPRKLTTFVRDGIPVRTLSRRVDGAFPSTINPVALWEIKEYYFTTTFGSRIADGVFETMLDGMELRELREKEGIRCRHYLMVDAYDTWWGMGKSYLCRMVDMLHMGLVDEILFGREVVERIPVLVTEWIAEDRAGEPSRSNSSGPIRQE